MRSPRRRIDARLILLASVAAAAATSLAGFSSPTLQRRANRTRADLSAIELPGRSRVEFLEMQSQALKGRGQFSIFYPPSYRTSDQTYPVVYFLHGLFNDHTSWTVNRYGNLAARIEGLMVSSKIPEFLLVHPNGGRSFYTNYADGSLRYEDFVVEELVGHVEDRFRAKKSRRYRAIAGTSMGGYGALKIAMRFPERYAAVAAHSPIVFLSPNPLDVPPAVRTSRRFAFFNEIFSRIFGDPFDQEHYDANNPLVLARQRSLGGLAIYFDYGTADRYNAILQLGRGLRALDEALSEEGISHTFRVHRGEPHGWALVVAHVEESLGFVSQTF